MPKFFKKSLLSRSGKHLGFQVTVCLHFDSTNVDFAYIVGGFKDGYKGYAIDEVWKYDIDKDTYTAVPSLPEPRAGGGLALVGRHLHYISGLKEDRDTDATYCSILEHSSPDLTNKAYTNVYTILRHAVGQIIAIKRGILYHAKMTF